MAERVMAGDSVFVHTSKGPVQGRTCWYNRGRNVYYSFQHVPYAQVPTGDLRFADPKDIQSFDDFKHLHLENNRYGREDYLFVHIYTPVLPLVQSDKYRNTRPVIVFVPSFWLEDSEEIYGPEFLMTENVVLVVLSYRQDILGFSGFRRRNVELNISGQAGLRDIMHGFKFVREEIRNFGGCPDNITAYGQGFSCAYIRQMITTTDFSEEFSAKKPFHKMILSSSMENSIQVCPGQSYYYDLRGVAAKIDPRMRFKDDKSCAEYLREIPLDKLLRHSEPMYKKSWRVARKSNMFGIGGAMYGVKMPVLIGFNALEGLIEPLIDPDHVPQLFTVASSVNYITSLLYRAQAAIDKDEIHRKALAIIGYTSPVEVMTDMNYVIGTIHLATNLAREMNPQNVYLYLFSASLPMNSTMSWYNRRFCSGAAHGDELGYIFNNFNRRPSVQRDQREENVVNRITKVWAQFARTGNPDPEGPNARLWRPIGEQLTHYLDIGTRQNRICSFSDVERERLLFWEKIYGIRFFSGPARILDESQETAGQRPILKTISDAQPTGKERHHLRSEKNRVPKYIIGLDQKPKRKAFVHTSKGQVQGHLCLDNGTYHYSFQHIPYAHVPVGKLRFAAPKDITSFLDVKQSGVTLDKTGRYGPEDNLFLHIYTREVAEEADIGFCTRPVIVFVPGRLSDKAEQYRSEDLYGPQFLLEQDVVLVVLSYRRDILGFTAFKEPNYELDVPIDAGVQDIIKGFRFVKDEIHHFGGCADNVTAYGQGTGATLVRMLAARYSEDALFHKMILSSSMEHVTGIDLPNPRFNVNLLAQILDKDVKEDEDDNEEDCIEFLRSLPIEELLKADSPMFEEVDDPENKTDVYSANRVICESHLLALSEENYQRKMPVLIGYNSIEGFLEPILNRFRTNKFLNGQTCFDRAVAQLAFDFNLNCRKTAKKITSFYDEEVSTADKRIILSDINYIIGTIALATHFAGAMGPENVYLYKFGVSHCCNLTATLYPGDDELPGKVTEISILCTKVEKATIMAVAPRLISRAVGEGFQAKLCISVVFISGSREDEPEHTYYCMANYWEVGAMHADELGYIFKTPISTEHVNKDDYEDPAWLAIKRMTTLWAEFARTGDPNPHKRCPALDQEKWRPIGQRLSHIFQIDTKDATFVKLSETDMKRYEFWESIINLEFLSAPIMETSDSENENSSSGPSSRSSRHQRYSAGKDETKHGARNLGS